MNCIKTEKQAPCVSHLPKCPGVYFFKNENSEILYIGKATSLFDRVKSYFQYVDTRPNIVHLLSHAVSVDYIETKTAEEALLLEAMLIQKHKPPYNILIKEGNPFLYIVKTNKKKDLPQLLLSRHQSGTISIGPFLHKKSARAIYEYIMRTFQLKLCNKKMPNGCLLYHIGQCAGSCKADFNYTEYETRLALAVSLLQKNKKRFFELLTTAMQTYIHHLQFETAARFATYKALAEQFFDAVQAAHVLERTQSAVFIIEHTPPDQETEYAEIEKTLQGWCGTDRSLQTIDCFDISHIQGRYMVGSAIRFYNGKAVPAQFRKFRIKTLQLQNDYAALAEIVSRRYKKDGYFPDLVLIDGGKGQKSSIDALALDVPVVAIAKKEERLFTDLYPNGIVLSLKNPAGRMLVALRDYAHHFAVSFHQKRKTAALKLES
jgi:excinuclease ABC subunit C